jgi:hypothetical protein
VVISNSSGWRLHVGPPRVAERRQEQVDPHALAADRHPRLAEVDLQLPPRWCLEAQRRPRLGRELLPSLARSASISAIRRSCSAMIRSLHSCVMLKSVPSSSRAIRSRFFARSCTPAVSSEAGAEGAAGAPVSGGPSRKAIRA